MITQSKLKELLHYNPETGVFTWLISPSQATKVGDMAGSLNTSGHRQIRVRGKEPLAHRLAFLYMDGSMPEEQVDHINHNRDDNRWCNLRLSTHTDNMKNKSTYKNNKSGVSGVSWSPTSKKWQCNVSINGKQKYLGVRSTIAEAKLLVESARAEAGYHENHGTR